MNKINYWIHAITPLHVGAGRGLGYIDMPIVREKVTNWPYIPGSSIKGVIADYYGASDEDIRSKEEHRDLKAAFGTTGTDDNCAAGALVFTDANILCLPVRSFYGTFAWITSPFCLRRVKPDLNLPDFSENICAFVTDNSKLIGRSKKLYLEDLDLTAQKNNEASEIANDIASSLFSENKEWQKIFTERFAIISDDFFTFLCEAGTEVNAHIRINEKTGIVAEGALWYEEALPVESILTGQIWCDKVFVKGITSQDLFERFCSGTITLQIGGKASTGKGFVRCIFGAGD
ncbi:MAG: type III-B CRISPR module RAMP protein Cmr4 [Synergistaceae bacterium]|nr:type III-B CRISPR module RAMP protein Cmr4 [Synergistaceae bacterium]